MPPPTEPFRVGIVPGVTVTKWTRAWKERRPETPLEVVPVTVAEQRDAITTGAVDVCFMRLPIDPGGLSVIRLYSETPVVVVPKEHPVTLFESVTMAELEGETVRPEEAADAVEIVAAGAGIMLVPHSIARLHARKDVEAVRISDADQTEIAVVWPSDTTTTDVEFFVGIVRGRTAASSRGAEASPATPPKAPAKGAKAAAKGGGSTRSAPSRTPRGAQRAKRKGPKR